MAPPHPYGCGLGKKETMTFLKKLLQFFLGLFVKKQTTLPSTQTGQLALVEAKADNKPEEAAPKPKVWTRAELVAEFLDALRAHVGVREKGDNRGPEVEMFQKALDGKAAGEPWCAALVQYGLLLVEKKTGMFSGVAASEHVRTVWNGSALLRVTEPQPGDLMVWGLKGSASGHIGVVESLLTPGTVMTIEGNTGPDRKGQVEREGDGVYRKRRQIQGGQKLQVLGFLRPWKALDALDGK
jgi:hypothetical protein